MIKKFKFDAVNPVMDVDSGKRVNFEGDDSYLKVNIELEVDDKTLLQLFEEKEYLTVDGNLVKYHANVTHNEITTSVYCFVERNYEEENITLMMIKLFETLNIWQR